MADAGVGRVKVRATRRGDPLPFALSPQEPAQTQVTGEFAEPCRREPYPINEMFLDLDVPGDPLALARELRDAVRRIAKIPTCVGIRARPGRKTLVVPIPRDGEEQVRTTRSDPALVKALARAFRYQKLLDEGRYGSITEMAVEEKIERGYLGTLLRLTLLAPEVVEAIVDGSGPGEIGLPTLLEPFPEQWSFQRERLL